MICTVSRTNHLPQEVLASAGLSPYAISGRNGFSGKREGFQVTGRHSGPGKLLLLIRFLAGRLGSAWSGAFFRFRLFFFGPPGGRLCVDWRRRVRSLRRRCGWWGRGWGVPWVWLQGDQTETCFSRFFYLETTPSMVIPRPLCLHCLFSKDAPRGCLQGSNVAFAFLQLAERIFQLLFSQERGCKLALSQSQTQPCN